MSWEDNPQWQTTSPAGLLDITINLAKPEKDPRAIAAAAQSTSDACVLCWEQDHAPEGRLSSEASELSVSDGMSERRSQRSAHLLRTHESVTEITLANEPWAWWFSPYGYFPEHLIVASLEHRPMSVTPTTLERLLDFVDAYPQYFIGSNADIPIVGGSLLAHDHFQGGCYQFPLMRAPIAREVLLNGEHDVHAGIVQWPASVLRLTSPNRVALQNVAAGVLEGWRMYSDAACDILATTQTNEGISLQHNSLNPIVWREGDVYVLDLVLRNNRTTPERPYGLFHPDESLFHIKKENIGLIEIMGRAILPARLADQLPEIKEEANRVFYQVLQATGVFKHDAEGEAGWDRFIAYLNS